MITCASCLLACVKCVYHQSCSGVMEFSSRKTVTNEKSFVQNSRTRAAAMSTTQKGKPAVSSLHKTQKPKVSLKNEANIPHAGLLVRNKRSSQWLWPGHNYMGPGNPLENGAPTTHADKVAQGHDYAYAHAWSHDDIKEADRKAISQFMEKPYQVSSLVGAAGLSVKSLAEKWLGPVYPGPADLGSRVSSRSIMVQSRKKKHNA